jgi:tetratricopeptide (TPR) repeat protein
MGSVYKAHDPLLDRPVAIKVMTEGADVGSEARERFLREAQSAARLNHPNIITIYELGQDQGQIFIVMELLEGQPLSRVIAASPPWPLHRKLTLMLQICEGLAFAHQRGVIHRDIKPGNIFVLGNGQVKILDFGIARLASSDLTRTGLLMGTPNYMSPEQARGQRTDARSDIFSVGVVFYELLSGRKPFSGEDYFQTMEKVRSEDPAPLLEVIPALPPPLAYAVMRMLAKDPAVRYQSLDDLRANLLPVRDQIEGESTGDLRQEVERRFAEVSQLQQTLIASVGAAALDDETLPEFLDPGASHTGLQSVLRNLEAQTERLRAFARKVERFEAAVQRGIAAFERGDFAQAATELDAVLVEIPQHQRARDYRDRARLAQIRERTIRSFATGRLATDEATAPAEPAPPREVTATTPVLTQPPLPVTGTKTATEVTRGVSRDPTRLALAAVAVVVLVVGGVFLFRASGPPAPGTAPPAVEPTTQPAPGAGVRPSSAPRTPAPSAAKSPSVKSRPAESRLTPEQARELADYLELAKFHRERGDNERALGEYQRALEIDPANAEARRGVAEVNAALKAKR